MSPAVISSDPPLKPSSKLISEQRRDLPIYSARQLIINTIEQYPTVILVGETGSGKTTQIPQYWLEHRSSQQPPRSKKSHRHSPMQTIAITQPRRVAATTLAKRVALEVGTKLGEKVGYSVRFDEKTSPQTRIKYLTDGMLMRELITDPWLKKYELVILDEAHERSLRTDILFAMLKKVQHARANVSLNQKQKYSELKLVIMSATLDSEKFASYFTNSKILYVEGRQYPVKLYHSIEPQKDYLDSALVTIFQVHIDKSKGDILVFLSGQEEIESLAKLILEYSLQLPATADKLLVCPIFANLPAAQQYQAFLPAPNATRKVVLATNIAETSITIPGIRYVIDTGVAKMRVFNAKSGLESLQVYPISKSSAWQRTGRSGREGPGECYRLYSEETFQKLEECTEPEIKRCNLAYAMLLLKAYRVENPFEFDFMDPPQHSAMLRAMEQLFMLGALSPKGALTEIGQHMSEYPLDPTYAKVLIHSLSLGCVDAVITMISLLLADSIFYSPSEKRAEAAEARKQFFHHSGDHMTMYNAYLAYRQTGGDKHWCRDHFINHRAMKQVTDIRNQLLSLCQRHSSRHPTNDFSHSLQPGSTSFGNLMEDEELQATVLQCFLQGFFSQTATLQPDQSYRTTHHHQTIWIHPSSTLFGKKVPAIVFNEMTQTSKLYARGVSQVEPAWIEKVHHQFTS